MKSMASSVTLLCCLVLGLGTVACSGAYDPRLENDPSNPVVRGQVDRAPLQGAPEDQVGPARPDVIAPGCNDITCTPNWLDLGPLRPGGAYFPPNPCYGPYGGTAYASVYGCGYPASDRAYAATGDVCPSACAAVCSPYFDVTETIVADALVPVVFAQKPTVCEPPAGIDAFQLRGVTV
jgi:hypothetical protein